MKTTITQQFFACTSALSYVNRITIICLYVLTFVTTPVLASNDIDSLKTSLADSLLSANAMVFLNVNDSVCTLRETLRSCLPLLQAKTTGEIRIGDSTIRAALKKYPQSSELKWLDGLFLLHTGSFIQGIRSLDSLRTGGFNNNGFLTDYARHVFKILLPKNGGQVLFTRTDSHLETDTAVPFATAWTISGQSDKSQSFPLFSMTAKFSFHKPFPLDFSSVIPSHKLALTVSIPDSLSPSYISQRMLDILSDRTDYVACRIFIDLSNVNCSQNEYLSQRISGYYDSIEIRKNDLPAYNALSLRCYARNFLFGREGQYAAYITFDRFFTETGRPENKKSNLSIVNRPVKIRFTIAMESGIDISDIAEEKLQSLLALF